MTRRVVLTRDWLVEIENRINYYTQQAVTDAQSRYMAFNLKPPAYSSWSMEVAHTIAGMKAQNVKRVCAVENFIDLNKGSVSTKIRAHVELDIDWFPEDEQCFVDIVLFWTGQQYETVGVLLPLSEYVKIAKYTNYQIEVACSKGSGEFSAPFMFWYYNDTPKVKGKHKIESLPLDVGSTNYYLHSVNLGYGSDPLLTLNGTTYHWGYELEEQARSQGNESLEFNFWRN